MKQKLSYYLIDPTKNYTLLVDSPVPAAKQPVVAARLMEMEPLAEQVGFLTEEDDSSVCLRMAGGEFCGNAAMSAALVRASRAGGARADVAVRVLGAEVSVRVHMEKDDGGNWTGSVEMPEPVSIERFGFSENMRLPVVYFPGIAHVIVERPPEKSAAEALAPRWCGLLDADALGMMFYDRVEGSMTPLVYVPSADTLFWESSCASGTAALGYYLRDEKGAPLRTELKQPGGVLRISIDGRGPLRLTGSVQIVYRRETELDF